MTPAHRSKPKRTRRTKVQPDRIDPWLLPYDPHPSHDIRDWVPSKHNARRFETEAAAENYRRLEIGKLLHGTSHHHGIAEKYDACKPEDPCGQCRTCGRQYCINFVARCLEAIDDFSPATKMVSATLIPSSGWHLPGHLHEASLRDFNQALRMKMRRSGLSDVPAILGTDISFNVDSEMEFPSGWQLHAQGVFICGDKFKLKTELAGEFPQNHDVGIFRPTKLESVNDLSGKLSYSFKRFFTQRPSYRDESGKRKVGRAQALRKEQFLELSEFLNKQGFGDRLLFQGFRRRGKFLVRED